MSESANMPLQPNEEYKPGVVAPVREEPGEILPDEIPFGLTRMEYQILRGGEINESRAGRDFCLGSLLSAVTGLLGLIMQVNWGETFRQARLGPFVWAAVLFGVALASAFGALIQHRHGARDNRPYYALMARLTRYFEERDPSNV
jgi:hypothetical protein